MGAPMALELVYEPGQTPLDLDEAAQLIPRHIVTQGQLNEWEQVNIQRALPWARRAARARTRTLTEDFCRELHRRMFDQTWKWAGTFRTSDKNIGCDWRQVPLRLRQLLDNTQYQLDHGTNPLDETAARFHHALVLIHVFPNGNGRHAREMANCLLREHGAEPFTWGRGSLVHAGELRARYLLALQAADRGDFAALFQFVRS